MLRFFRLIRRKLIEEENTRKYFWYATGEVFLVVIGILIALQINNWNELNKERAKEVNYLQNIKKDLILNNAQINEYIDSRNEMIQSASIVIEHFDGKPITDYSVFNAHTVNIYTWRKFFQINNTFQELTNSGNLTLISNDSLKTALQNLEASYLVMKDEEAHFRFDAELLLYAPSYETNDLNRIVQDYTYKVTGGTVGSDPKLESRDFSEMLKDIRQKNGFAMAVYQFTVLNQQLAAMKDQSLIIISMIDQEIEGE